MIRKRQRQFENPAITIILSADEKDRDGEAYLFPSNTRLRKMENLLSNSFGREIVIVSFEFDPQKILEQDNIIGDATNVSTGQIKTAVMEVNQTNVVKFNNKLESVAIDIRDIDKMRSFCQSINDKRFPVAEICLSAASLFAGAFFSAIISGVSLEQSIKSIAFYCICPAITVGCIVAFYFKRNNEQVAAGELARHILEYLPESDMVENGGMKNES